MEKWGEPTAPRLPTGGKEKGKGQEGRRKQEAGAGEINGMPVCYFSRRNKAENGLHIISLGAEEQDQLQPLSDTAFLRTRLENEREDTVFTSMSVRGRSGWGWESCPREPKLYSPKWPLAFQPQLWPSISSISYIFLMMSFVAPFLHNFTRS